MANMTLRRRTAMRGAGNDIDWESIARGMVDGTTEFSLPAEIWGSITAVPDFVCRNRKNLKSVVLPSGITKVGSASFYHCNTLMSVTFPDTLEVIDGTGFFYCEALTEVELPATMTSINSQAFNFVKMATLVIHATTPPTLAANAFKSGYPLKIYVPDNSEAAYKAANNWSSMASRIFPLSDKP